MLMAAALEQLAEGVILTDKAGRITFVNDAASRLHGVARLDVPPEDYAESYQLLTENGEPYPSTELPLARAVLRGDTVLDARWRIRRPDGSEVFAVGSARPVLGPGGEQVGAVLTMRDDTPRVNAERADHRAASILEQVADEHLTLDADFRILTVNAAAVRALGVPREALVGRTHWEAFPASIDTVVERHYRRAMRERVHVRFSHHYIGEGLDRFLDVDAYPTDDGGLAMFCRDVSAIVRAERALREVTERYRVLYESVDTGFAIIDIIVDESGHPVDYVFVEVNAAFVGQTGLTDAIGRTAKTLVPGLESFWPETYARVAETGESMHFEQGSEAMGRWFDVSAVRISADARRVALLFRDITAQRKAAVERELLLESLAAQRQRLHEVFRQAPGFFALMNGPQHIFEFVNDGYDQLVGHRKLIGLPAFEALPDAREQGFELLLDQVLTTGVPFVGRATPIRLARAPGEPLEERFLDFTYAPMRDADGQPSGIIVHGVDVTDQVRARQRLEAAEQQLRTFANAIPTLAWTARADGYIDWYNARWYAYTGAMPEEMAGWGWQSVHDPAVLPAVLERWTASIATGREFEMTFPLRAADGTFQSFLTRVVPSRDADGTIIRWFGTAANIDGEQRMRRAAEDANRAKSDFLTIMSHELRTPLNAIDGYAELMEIGIRGTVTPEQRHDLARIRKSGKHLLGLINGVLNYAQVEAGAVHYEMESVSLDEVLTACHMLVAPLVRTNGLELHCGACAPDLMARVDRDKLQQIILNLLSNAIKFTESGGRIELLCTSSHDERGPNVRVAVGDTGIGIVDTQLARVFEPFVQVNSTLTRTSEGTGLGLAISRDLARAMDGDLTVESTLGVGSTFTLTLRPA